MNDNSLEHFNENTNDRINHIVINPCLIHYKIKDTKNLIPSISNL
ncbi:hypothetical protein Q7M_1257 (plasmid) [Borrelia crocidurae str. Achema]|uniref:Uncharacterized protein n=1 Tax=Borrelia crocidurae (strain Achema) TaxID=1155096 RepID=I0FEV8_BORCA|nr:hypothetical protein Q7M_1257 [Borrelia crocidurae str. Achema]